MSDTVSLRFPYGKEELTLELPSGRLQAVLTPDHTDGGEGDHSLASQQALVRAALASPIGSAPLHELARGKKNIVIIASDHTRPVPSRAILPPMLEEIRRGSPDADITLLIATGCHRGTTEAELLAKLGEEIMRQVRVVVHDCDDTDMLVDMGTLPSGGKLTINRLAAEADLLVSEGFIEPHFFAGFSGGRKSVLPGIAARESVMANHCAEFIGRPPCQAGLHRQRGDQRKQGSHLCRCRRHGGRSRSRLPVSAEPLPRPCCPRRYRYHLQWRLPAGSEHLSSRQGHDRRRGLRQCGGRDHYDRLLHRWAWR